MIPRKKKECHCQKGHATSSGKESPLRKIATAKAKIDIVTRAAMKLRPKILKTPPSNTVQERTIQMSRMTRFRKPRPALKRKAFHGNGRFPRDSMAAGGQVASPRRNCGDATCASTTSNGKIDREDISKANRFIQDVQRAKKSFAGKFVK